MCVCLAVRCVSVCACECVNLQHATNESHIKSMRLNYVRKRASFEEMNVAFLLVTWLFVLSFSFFGCICFYFFRKIVSLSVSVCIYVSLCVHVFLCVCVSVFLCVGIWWF